MKENKWSPDAIVGDAKLNSLFDSSSIVCAKTIYNYIDLGLLDVKNIDLPMKLKRNNKSIRNKINKKKLGTSIEERPLEIQTREEFGHWEIDTVIGEKTNSDNVLLTLVERKTRYTIALKITSKTSESVTDAIKKIKEEYEVNFSKVFKTITSDNGSEFSKLALIEDSTDSKIYFTHPYSSYERGTNERHNGLIRRFIPKGKRISDFSEDTISEIEEWMNTLPRRILGFKSPEDLFEEQLDNIYAA
jgi:IS30 family transposase